MGSNDNIKKNTMEFGFGLALFAIFGTMALICKNACGKTKAEKPSFAGLDAYLLEEVPTVPTSVLADPTPDRTRNVSTRLKRQADLLHTPTNDRKTGDHRTIGRQINGFKTGVRREDSGPPPTCSPFCCTSRQSGRKKQQKKRKRTGPRSF